MSIQRAPLLLALLLASLAVSQGDLYGNPSPSTPATPSPPSPATPSPPSPTPSPPSPATPSPPAGPAPPPPFAVKGKQFPPDTIVCSDVGSRCFGKQLTCPDQCPAITPADPKAKGCFLDCNSLTCESAGICRKRKPNCEGRGAACFDPRFVGGDGIMFYFHGKANHHFTLVSDANLHINARFIGLRPAGRPRDFTWIQALGIRFGPHSFTLSATPAAAWDPLDDHLALTFDGEPLPLDIGHRATWSFPAASGLRVERTATVNSVTVTLPKVFEIMASVVPVTKEDDRIHKYGIPADDCFAHLEVQFRFFGLSDGVEGVLGQTYRPDFKNPVKRGVPMPVMSGEDRYATSSLLSTDCRRCVFSPEVPALADAVAAVVSASTLDCTSKMNSGYGVVCRR